MKKLLIMLLLAAAAGLQAQDILTDQLIQPARVQSEKHFIEYEAGNYRVYVIDDKKLERFYVEYRPTGERIYDYTEAEERALHLKPRFFMKEGDPDLVILCMSLESTYSWGTYLFILDRGRVYHPGFIEWGADNFNFSALGLYCQFEQHGEEFIMFFQEDVRLIDYVTDDLHLGKDVEFRITRAGITRIK